MTTAPRRRDPQPIGRGWEPAVVAAGGALIAVALAALAGLGLASALCGDGWVWPHGTETVIHVLGGLLHGNPGRGLPPDQLRQVAGPVPVYACVAVAELVVVITANHYWLDAFVATLLLAVAMVIVPFPDRSPHAKLLRIVPRPRVPVRN